MNTSNAREQRANEEIDEQLEYEQKLRDEAAKHFDECPQS